jgi:hypothetical protein
VCVVFEGIVEVEVECQENAPIKTATASHLTGTSPVLLGLQNSVHQRSCGFINGSIKMKRNSTVRSR